MEEQEKYLPAELPKITQKEIDDFLFASGTKLTEQQKAMFYQIAYINGLNPFKREVYAIAYGDKFNLITGYEVYIKRAERTGRLDGWEADYVSDPNGDYAFCTIHRKDQRFPVTQKVWLSEFHQKNKMWNEKPKAMLIKVAIATAFRRAFPDEVGGLPYTSDEIPLEGEIIKQTPKTPPKQLQDEPKKQENINHVTGEIDDPRPNTEGTDGKESDLSPFGVFMRSCDATKSVLVKDYINSLVKASDKGLTAGIVVEKANKNIEGFKTKLDEWINA
jgi:hypothetical protein